MSMMASQHPCLRGLLVNNKEQEYECNKIFISSFIVMYVNIIITLAIFYSRNWKRNPRLFQCLQKFATGKTKAMLVPSCRHIILQVKEREEV